MADVKQVPKIQCDNCGFTEEKTAQKFTGDKDITYSKPHNWGGCKMEGTKDADAYGNKERLDMADLCPVCASVALWAASQALAKVRGDVEDGSTK